MREFDQLPFVCRSGQRVYYASQVLLWNGFKAENVSGGMLSPEHNYLLDKNEKEDHTS